MTNSEFINKIQGLYVILDAARIFGEIETAQQLQTKFVSLYSGKNEELLSSVAPHLFHFNPESEFSSWFFSKGWGNSWGVFIEADVELEQLHMHFRKFLMVKTVEGKEFYFRFYDPRVLRKFVPACEQSQLKDFFGPVKAFFVEDENPDHVIRFALEDGKLVKEKWTYNTLMNFINNDGPIEKQVTKDISNDNDNDNTAGSPPTNKGWTFLID